MLNIVDNFNKVNNGNLYREIFNHIEFKFYIAYNWINYILINIRYKFYNIKAIKYITF